MHVVRFSTMDGVYILKSQASADPRGRFVEAYNFDQLQEACGLEGPFMHSEFYYLIANSLVGLYYQEENPRASMYHCLHGHAQFVAVDMRKDSKTFGKHEKTILDSQQCLGFFTKAGFATGFIAFNGPAVIYAQHSTREIKSDQKTLKWDDLQIAVAWASRGNPILGIRERQGRSFGEIKPYEEL